MSLPETFVCFSMYPLMALACESVLPFKGNQFLLPSATHLEEGLL